MVDSEGAMRLQWWPGNEKLKGAPQPADFDIKAVANTRSRNLTQPLNNRNGTVLEGTSVGGCAGGVILYSSNQNSTQGPTFAIEIGVDDELVFHVLQHQLFGPSMSTVLLESFDRDIPLPQPGQGCHFRVLIRGSMVEVYVSDVLTLPIPLSNTVSRGGPYDGTWAAGVRSPTIQVGLNGSWAAAGVKLEAWTVDLPALFPMP